MEFTMFLTLGNIGYVHFTFLNHTTTKQSTVAARELRQTEAGGSITLRPINFFKIFFILRMALF